MSWVISRPPRALSDHVGYTTAEMDSVILAWEAKTKYNRARPTQLVNDGDSGFNNTINSWDGMGYGPIAASQWDAMIRVMPHAEYPSGSGCICTVVAHYVDRYAAVEHSLDAFKTHWNVGSGTELTYQNMTELRDACGSVCACPLQYDGGADAYHCLPPASPPALCSTQFYAT